MSRARVRKISLSSSEFQIKLFLGVPVVFLRVTSYRRRGFCDIRLFTTWVHLNSHGHPEEDHQCVSGLERGSIIYNGISDVRQLNVLYSTSAMTVKLFVDHGGV